MTTESNAVLRGEKCADIILSLNSLFHVDLEKATDIFYSSDTSKLIEEGVADLHCRSNKYLATVIWDEYCQR